MLNLITFDSRNLNLPGPDSWGILCVTFSVCTYVVIAPSISVIPSFGLYNNKRVFQLVLIGICAGTLLVSRRTCKQWLVGFGNLPTAGWIGLTAVLILGVFSVTQAPAWENAALELSHFVVLFALAGTVAAVSRIDPRRTAAFILGAVLLSVLLYMVHFSVSYSLSVAWPSVEPGKESITGFANTRHFNQYQTWTLPLLGSALLSMPQRWRTGRGFVFILLAVWWMLVLVSNVRGTVVALGLAVVGVGLLFRRHAVRWLSIQVGAVVGGGILYYLLFDLIAGTTPQVAERLGSISGEAWRIQRWTMSLELAWAHPWLGLGPMHFAWPPYHFLPGAHPHNALLQWMVEWGLPSASIMTGLVVWGGWSWMRQERREAPGATRRENAVRVGLVAAVLAGAAHSMVSGIIVMPVSQVLLALVGGWAWGRYRYERRPSKETSWISHAVLCVLLIGSVGIVGSSVRDVLDAEERQLAYLEAVEEPTFWPRYWKQGYIGVRKPKVMERAAEAP